MIAVVVRADQPEFFDIFRTSVPRLDRAGREIDLDSLRRDLGARSRRFDLAQPFWRHGQDLVRLRRGRPSLKKLLLRLLVTDYAHHLKADVPTPLGHLLPPTRGGPMPSSAWPSGGTAAARRSSYDRLSDEVGDPDRSTDHLHGLEIDDLVDVMTFLAVEKRDRQRAAGSGPVHGGHDRRRGGADSRHPAAGRPLGLERGAVDALEVAPQGVP